MTIDVMEGSVLSISPDGREVLRWIRRRMQKEGHAALGGDRPQDAKGFAKAAALITLAIIALSGCADFALHSEHSIPFTLFKGSGGW